MKPFDTDKMPWLFTPHGDGELNEYFSTDHSKIVAETSKEVLASLSESRDRLSGKLCYEFHYNQRRYKNTLLRFADNADPDKIIIIQKLTVLRSDSLSHDFSPLSVKAHGACCDIPPEARHNKKTWC